MVTVREVFEREAGLIGTHTSMAYQRRFYRDFACLLWLIFEDLEAKGHGRSGLDRAKFLKFLTLGDDESNEMALGVLRGLITLVVAQTRELKREGGSFRDIVESWGIDVAARHMLITLRVFMTNAEGVTRMLMLPLWAEHGFPVVQVGHKLAASLLVTRVSEDVVDGMALPWPVFEIELPGGMFETLYKPGDGSAEMQPLATLLCGVFNGCFDEGARDACAILANAQSCSVWNVKHHIKELGDVLEFSEGEVIDPWPDPRLLDVSSSLEATDEDARTLTMLARLFVGTSLMMTASGNYRPIGKGHDRPTSVGTVGSKRRMPFPTTRIFQLTQVVRHDFRDVVGEYLRGGGKSPTVQSMVTGHWKMQAHGVGRSQRKPIFVEAYWRGPEDAPIAVRSQGSRMRQVVEMQNRRMGRYQYVGRRLEDRSTLVVIIGPKGESPLNPRYDLRRHSPTGYEWGYSGSGPAQLALALLAHCVGDGEALRWYQRFKFRFVAAFDSDAWSMTDAEVRAAVRALREEGA